MALINESTGEELEVSSAGIAAAIEAGKIIGSLGVATIEGVPHLFKHKDMTLESLEGILPFPKRVKCSPLFREPESFIRYVKEFANKNTRIYGDQAAGLMLAAIDDHEAIPSGSGEGVSAKARWVEHQAHLRLVPSDEWTAWVGKNKQWISHVDFVEHLQDRISTIARPDAAVIIDAARHFSAHRNAQFKQVVPVSGGDLELAYAEEVRGVPKEGTTTLPGQITLSIRPYRCRDDRVTVEVHIRWRLSREGQLTFSFSMLRMEETMEEAFAEVRAEVEEETALKVLL